MFMYLTIFHKMCYLMTLQNSLVNLWVYAKAAGVLSQIEKANKKKQGIQVKTSPEKTSLRSLHYIYFNASSYVSAVDEGRGGNVQGKSRGCI